MKEMKEGTLRMIELNFLEKLSSELLRAVLI
jgi:hypothetical protein